MIIQIFRLFFFNAVFVEARVLSVEVATVSSAEDHRRHLTTLACSIPTACLLMLLLDVEYHCNLVFRQQG